MSALHGNDPQNFPAPDPPVTLKLVAFVADDRELERAAIRSALDELRCTDESLRADGVQVETRALALTARGTDLRIGGLDTGQAKMLGTALPIPYGMIAIRLP